MNMKKAFTMLELLVAFALAAFIMMGVIGLYNGLASYAKKMREQSLMQQTVFLVFRQLEQDVSTAFIPELEQPIKGAGEKASGAKGAEGAKEESKKEDATGAKETKTKEQLEKEKKQKEEQLKSFFIGQIDDRADLTKIEGKKVEVFKFITMICSNPLLVHEEKRPRLVRVFYEMIKDKAHSTKDADSYMILRKETADLKNTYAKVDEFARVPRELEVKTYTIASNIKTMAFEYISLQKDKNEVDGKPAQPKEIRSFTWPARVEHQGHVPQRIHLWIEIWNDDKTAFRQFNTVIPIFSFPTFHKTNKEKEKDQDLELGNAKKKKMEETSQKSAGKEENKSLEEKEGQKKQDQSGAGGDAMSALKNLMGQR